MKSNAEIYDLAMGLVDAVRNALKNGIKHYAMTGELLENENDIIAALLRDGQIMVHDPPRH